MQGSCVACKVEGRVEAAAKRWGAGGVPLCMTHSPTQPERGRVKGGDSKLEAALELAMAVVQKREAIDLTHSSDSDVEVVESCAETGPCVSWYVGDAEVGLHFPGFPHPSPHRVTSHPVTR
jgi:hypothetical protein